MNYYPNNNFYQGYSYGGTTYQPQQAQPTIPSLQGKVVDSIDMVRVNEVPFGGFGIFPKGDLSEVYIKSWNSNGTTQINTYRPIPAEELKENKEISSQEELLEKINTLNEKLDTLMKGIAAAPNPQPTQQVQQTSVKDVKVNAY